MIKKAYMTLIYLFILLFLSSCSTQDKEAFKYKEQEDSFYRKPIVDLKEVPQKISTPEENLSEITKQELKDYEITISVVGDVMVHRPQLVRAYNKERDIFDFSETFLMIDEYIIPYDYAIANLETTLSGKDEGLRLESSQYYKGYQGYPTFNSPEILASNLKNAGFDMVTTANNHSFDGWTGGLVNTLNVLDLVGLDHVGTYQHEDDEKILVKQIQGINVAFHNYTYSTNGIIPPTGSEYMVNSLNNYDEDLLNEMYEEVKQFINSNGNVDFNIVYIHFGNEYHIESNQLQREICSELIKAGADIIIGSHPHVLQPIEVIEVVNEDNEIRKGLVIYSLGNFISSQKFTTKEPIPKDAGIIFNLTLNKRNNKTNIKKISIIPTWVQWSGNFIRVIPVEKAILLYDKGNYYNLTNQDYSRLLEVQKFTVPHMFSRLETEPIKVGDEFYIEMNDILQ